jgi:glycosyltransferase involved in cell wall biosynthesis
MRIALISTYGVKCGIATYTDHLARELSKKHEVKVFAEDVVGNSQPEFNSEIEYVRCFNRENNDRRLEETLKSYNPDVIHIQHEYGIFRDLKEMLLRVRKAFSGRTVMTLHTVNISNGFDLHDCADFFIVHKESARDYLLMEGVSGRTVRVIPHGTLVVPHIPAEQARKKLGLPIDRKIILSHAFFERRKNIDKIIMAVAELRHEIPLYYIHVGDIHPQKTTSCQIYHDECVKAVRQLGLENYVKFVKRFIPDEKLVYYLNACDVIVTLENDNYPRVCASGIMHTVAFKPVIASDVTNFNEFPDGSFYRIDIDVDSLKHAIREIVFNPDLSARLSHDLLSYAAETSWEKVAKEHIRLYEECLSISVTEQVT